MDDKQEFKRELLNRMSEMVEEIHFGYYLADGLFDRTNLPLAFKPGVADKMLFNRIIDEHFDAVYAASTSGYTSNDKLAFGLLMNYYFPFYGEKSRGISKKKLREMRRDNLNMYVK